jgi:hypothetical protein
MYNFATEMRRPSFLPFLEFPFWEFIFDGLGLSTNTAIEPVQDSTLKKWFNNVI